MKHELKLYAIAVIGILAMMLTYSGNAGEQAKRVTVEANEIVHSEQLTVIPTSEAVVVPTSSVVPTAEPVVLMDDGEIELALQLMASEANTEDATGQALVLCVALNRVNQEGFPNNLHDVVYQCNNGRYQFSPVKDGTLWTAEPTDATYKALEMVLNGWDESQGATYFCSEGASDWHDRDLEPLFEHGCHKFYKRWDEEK